MLAAALASSALVMGIGRAAGTMPTIVSTGRLTGIETAVRAEIADGHIPGAVIVVGQGDAILFRRAFGSRTDGATAAPMTVGTVFDLASVTKVVATTTAVMQLVERGLLSLDASVARYWPEFAAHGKRAITVRHLLTHSSGLRPDPDLHRPWRGYASAVRVLAGETAVAPPGTRYIYSDENFAVLGELVRRVSGLPLDVYCARNIFGPLAMHDTRFRPAPEIAATVAPTSAGVRLRALAVNDPVAARMDGVAGHAGLFSTADDLTRFARMLIHGGDLDSVRVLTAASVAAMTAPQSPPSSARVRGFGWDLGPAGSDRVPVGSYGHTGYTGTMIWIDPVSRAFAIVLTNRTYKGSRGDAQPLRDAVLRIIFAPAAVERAISATAPGPASARTALPR